MKREWKPGDVAVVKYGDVEQVAIVRPRSKAMHALEFAYLSGGYDMVNAVSQDARPLVVIDPEDREQVERLESLMAAHNGWTLLHNAPRVGYMQAALREFANPTPPKPDEPQGLGAVVEDADGGRWVRWKSMERKPWRLDFGVCLEGEGATYRYYADIAAVRVLSEGVTP